MVKLSSLHDEGGPVEALHHFHLIELVNALRMVVISLILGVSSSTFDFFGDVALAGNFLHR
jgi:hypothetical protein